MEGVGVGGRLLQGPSLHLPLSSSSPRLEGSSLPQPRKGRAVGWGRLLQWSPGQSQFCRKRHIQRVGFFTPLTPVVAHRNFLEYVCDKPNFSNYHLLLARRGTKSLFNDGELTCLMTNFVTCAMPHCRAAPPCDLGSGSPGLEQHTQVGWTNFVLSFITANRNGCWGGGHHRNGAKIQARLEKNNLFLQGKVAGSTANQQN